MVSNDHATFKVFSCFSQPEPAQSGVEILEFNPEYYDTDHSSYYTDDEDLKRMGGGKDFGSLWGRMGQ